MHICEVECVGGWLELGFWRLPGHALVAHIDHLEAIDIDFFNLRLARRSDTWRIAHVQCERHMYCMPDLPPRAESCWADPAPLGAYGLQVCSHYIAGISCMRYDTFAHTRCGHLFKHSHQNRVELHWDTTLTRIFAAPCPHQISSKQHLLCANNTAILPWSTNVERAKQSWRSMDYASLLSKIVGITTHTPKAQKATSSRPCILSTCGTAKHRWSFSVYIQYGARIWRLCSKLKLIWAQGAPHPRRAGKLKNIWNDCWWARI